MLFAAEHSRFFDFPKNDFFIWAKPGQVVLLKTVLSKIRSDPRPPPQKKKTAEKGLTRKGWGIKERT
jgi:hypothetical protein